MGTPTYRIRAEENISDFLVPKTSGIKTFDELSEAESAYKKALSVHEGRNFVAMQRGEREGYSSFTHIEWVKGPDELLNTSMPEPVPEPIPDPIPDPDPDPTPDPEPEPDPEDPVIDAETQAMIDEGIEAIRAALTNAVSDFLEILKKK